MRAALFKAPRSIEVGDRPDASISEPTDAVVRVALACVCGSDLWYYRGDSEFEPGPIGHEFVGVVEDVGAEVQDIAKGDVVVAPFAFSDGTCPHCRHGITSACANGGFFPMNGDGGQGEAVRVPLADGTLVPVPANGHSDETMRSLLTLSDVMCTGHHAAACAGVKAGDTVAVVGAGAVGSRPPKQPDSTGTSRRAFSLTMRFSAFQSDRRSISPPPCSNPRNAPPPRQGASVGFGSDKPNPGTWKHVGETSIRSRDSSVPQSVRQSCIDRARDGEHGRPPGLNGGRPIRPSRPAR
jgi:hypothetical protein